MTTFMLIVLGAAVFTVLGWVAAALLWLKNADLADDRDYHLEVLKDARRDNARLRYRAARDWSAALAEAALTLNGGDASPKVVPIRSARP